MPRQPKSDAMRRLKGTDKRPRKGPEPAPKDTLTELPAAPAWVAASPAALAEWDRCGKVLISIGGLRESTLSTFGHYCCAHSDVLAVRQDGGIPKPPLVASLLALSKSFRLTGLSTPLAQPTKKSVNPFDAFRQPRPTHE